jgi:hypothetical protein
MLTVHTVKASTQIVMKRLILPSLLLGGLAMSATAAPSNCPQPVGVVNSSNGGVFQRGSYSVALKYDFYAQDQLYKGSDDVDFVRPQQGEMPAKKPYETTFQRYRLTFRTGLFKRVDARLAIPVLVKEMKRKSLNNEFSDDQSGIGDSILIGRYQILSQKEKNPFNLAFGAGLSLPTGSTDEEDGNGATLPGFLQTGSGSWDPVFELGAHKLSGRMMFTGHLMYRVTTEGELGDQDFERPDVFKYNAGGVYALSNLFDAQLELNGVVKSKAELNGVKNDNTGGHLLYLTPGVHVKFWKKMHCDVGVPIVVYRDFNGTQLSEEYQVVVKLAMPF